MDDVAASYEWRVGLGDWCAEQPLAAALLAAAVALALLGWFYAATRERHAVPGRLRLMLNLLRLVAILAALVLVARIERRPLQAQTVPSVVAVLTDTSASMALPISNEADDAAMQRGEVADTVAEYARAGLAVQHNIATGVFADRVQWEADAELRSNSTRLGAGIDEALQRFRGQPLAGVVLLTDGRTESDSATREAAARAKAAGMPLHLVSIGPTTEALFSRVRSVEAPTRCFAGDPIRIACQVDSNRPEQQVVRVRVLIAPDADQAEWRELAVGEASGSAGEGLVFDTEVPAPAKGVWKIKAELVDPLPGDKPLGAATTIEVIDRKTRVLLLAGGPTRDYRYLRDALRRDNSFVVRTLLQSGDDSAASVALAPLNAFPSGEQLREEFDVVIGFDPDLSLVSETEQHGLIDWIADNAGGVVYVAGPIHTGDTVRRSSRHPLLRSLPIEFSTDRFAWRSAANTQPHRLEVDPAAVSEPALRLPSAGSDETGWSELDVYASPLPTRLKVGATTLLSYADEDSAPFYARTRYGVGRVAFLASGEIWRLRKVDAAAFVQFYIETLRWAAQGRLLGEADEGELSFAPAAATIGEPLTVRFTRPASDPQQDLKYELTHPNGRVEIRRLRAADSSARFEAEDRVTSTEAGRYVARLSVADEVYTAEAVASIAEVESRATTRNDQLLQDLAESTGGTFVGLDSIETVERIAKDLVRAIPSQAETRTVVGDPDQAFRFGWSAWWGALAGIALVLEWSMRRALRLA